MEAKASMGKGVYQGGGGGEGSYQPAKEDLAQHCLSTCGIGPWDGLGMWIMKAV